MNFETDVSDSAGILNPGSSPGFGSFRVATGLFITDLNY